MEAIIFIGIQATGKSSFYKERFYRTHIRINLDMLKTRHREDVFLHACIKAKQSFVVDNTNTTLKTRRKYIELARDAGFTVTGYYFASNLQEALKRNAARLGEERIPDAGVFGAYRRLQLPIYAEGFDELFYVSLTEQGFTVKEWADEI
jgi:predicted kinase